ncbi:winged helix-turn-helix transcriptional regulator [Candidatus Woesearchaeota archaeon]|nr:winged helix-turn-helix transcriptional regulator [Candidatus Woesearchaeota archaeon]
MIRIYHQRITLVRTRKPAEKNINQELQWFGNSLGLFNLRDKDKSCFRVFIELLKAAKANMPLTSDELAYRLNLSRGTVIHHINKLMDAGIVIYDGKRYMLRVDNLKDLVDEVEKDIERTCLDLKEIAQEIDKRLGL